MIDPKNGKEYPVNPNRVWAVTIDTFPQYMAENRIIFPGDYDFLKNSKPQMRYFRDEDEARAIKKTGNIAGVSATTAQLPTTVGMTKEGTADLGELFAHKAFPYPKPVELIKYLVQIGTINNNNSVILDFFAGSGTTGQAVLKYNAEHVDSSRKFILCTNNENNICRDVTYERIKRVIAKEDYKASLKYFKVDYLPISDKLYYEYADELLLHIRELVELENGINFKGNSKVAIILTETELDNFTQNIPKTCKTIYVGHDVLPTGEQEKMFAKRKIKVNVIPEYYYRDLEG